MNDRPTSDFEKMAKDESEQNLLTEFWDFLRHNKKWWLVPILLVMLVFGALMLIPSAAAPFIYTLF